MADILQIEMCFLLYMYSIFVFHFKFLWSLFLWIQWTSQYCFRQWVCAKPVWIQFYDAYISITSELSSYRAIDDENVSISWCHHHGFIYGYVFTACCEKLNLNSLFKQTKKYQSSTLLVLYLSNPWVTGGFPTQRASNAESVSMSWCHHHELIYGYVFVTCFRKYFRAICDVPEPENKFNMDQYSDVTKITKPVIYITIAEIIETHKVFLFSSYVLWFAWVIVFGKQKNVFTFSIISWQCSHTGCWNPILYFLLIGCSVDIPIW